MTKKEPIRELIESAINNIVNVSLDECNSLTKALADSPKGANEPLEIMMSLLSNVAANVIRALSMPDINYDQITAHDREAALMSMYLVYIEKILVMAHNVMYHEGKDDEKCSGLLH